ncbi:hypothetical protein LWI28_010095 [Acer negundo]|uniref:Bet v I/Major latex protein domain-containing protein n=1 Tax=Acer negundo TaxID=4023 RepID=A0AAD5IMH3_ACENE|nr:hypothetical protein LWI28_010095 [Acer negundo]KAK4842453.1 hypothetical protein QYF36_021936 [Acer negundo]
MSLICQVETDIEIKTPADKFHEVFSCRPHHMSNVTSEKIQGVELHEGEWGKVGSIIFWNYMHDGVAETAKEVIEAIDDENYSTTFRVIEGHLLEKYKDFDATVQVTPKKDGGSLVHWTIKYEKANEQAQDAKGIIQLVSDMTKDLDAHLIEQA